MIEQSTGANFPSEDKHLLNLVAPSNVTLLDSDFLKISLVPGSGSTRDLLVEVRDTSTTAFLGEMRLQDQTFDQVTKIVNAASRPFASHHSQKQRIHDQLQVLEAVMHELDKAVEEDATFVSDCGCSPTEAILNFCEKLSSHFTSDDVLSLLNKQEILPGLNLITSRSWYLISSAFLRFAEHYESPKFRTTVFSMEEYKEWYRQQTNGQGFTYHFDWEGYNVPGYATVAMREGKFGTPSPAEQALLTLVGPQQNKYALLGATENDRLTIEHELAHGLYFVSDEYRQEVNDILSKYDLSIVNEWLAHKGYAPTVFLDEAHAYLNEPEDCMAHNGFNTPEFLQAHEELQVVFKKYSQSE